MEKIYYTDRLILKVLRPTHAQIVLDYFIRNNKFLQEWDPIKNDEFFTISYQKKILENELTKAKQGNMLRLWIMKKNDLQMSKVIGTIAFSNIVRGAFLSCYLGYRLDKDEINKGFITEALSKGINIMFKDYGLHRIEANIMPRNIRSIKVVKKLGFEKEGLSRKYLKINNKWEDHFHYVLLNDELE
ncbi:GNAT family N-acetyltransferase [Abyssisolibacter fermentans]|uniref:GNAT family N-acetyltransferase n=1 Tax=Abyssisolibacter fermentans TaxID=1766203 RepID=UPI000835BF5F|nr:GNAT family N-acetyltransferase [Abyssisolibacter fermentans]